MKDERSLVVPGRHSSEALERVHAPLNFVAAGIERPVKTSGTTASAAAPPAVGLLVPALGNGVPDLPPPQVDAVPTGAVRLIAAQMVRAGPRVPTSWAWDTDAVQDRDQLRRITPLSGSDQYGQRAASAVTRQVDLGGETRRVSGPPPRQAGAGLAAWGIQVPMPAGDGPQRRAVGGRLAMSDESAELRFVLAEELNELPMHHTQRLRLQHFLEHRERPYLADRTGAPVLPCTSSLVVHLQKGPHPSHRGAGRWHPTAVVRLRALADRLSTRFRRH